MLWQARAVHLEHSDNVYTYQSAVEKLKQLFKSVSLKESLNRQGVLWQFIPKCTSWYGGFWECLIGLTKTAIKKVLGWAFVSLATLQIMVVEIEGHLNNSEIDDLLPREFTGKFQMWALVYNWYIARKFTLSWEVCQYMWGLGVALEKLRIRPSEIELESHFSTVLLSTEYSTRELVWNWM